MARSAVARARAKEEARNTSVTLADGATSAPKRYVHYRTEAFAITSDVPVEALDTCEVLRERLCSDLGRYIYPSDATIEFFAGDTIETVRHEWQARCQQDAFNERVYHMSVATVAPPVAAPPEEEEDMDDEERGEDEEPDEDEDEYVATDEDKEELSSEEDEAPIPSV